MINDNYILKFKELLESVKMANDSEAYVMCCKEYESWFIEHFPGYKVITIDDEFVVNKDTVYIVPYMAGVQDVVTYRFVSQD